MSSPYGRALLICNGSRRAKAVAGALPEIRRQLEARELEHEIVSTRARGDAISLARRFVERGGRFVVAVGGDGTVNEVVNGVMTSGVPSTRDVVLGVIALGRGLDFVRTFGIPALPGHAVAHLDGPESFPIDVGRVTFHHGGAEITRYFANVAEVGLEARVRARAAHLPSWFGPTAFLIAFWSETLLWRSADAKVDLVDRGYEGPLDALVVANGQFSSGGKKIAPRAAPTDGLLDVLVDHVGRWERIALLPKVYRGEHLPHPDIRLAKRVRVSIDGPPLPLTVDGEALGRTPALFEVLPGALRLKV